MGSIDSQILNNRARAETAKNLSKEYANSENLIIDPETPEERYRSAKWWSLYAPDLVSEFFVNENGKDNDPNNYPGKSNSGAFATIARACQAVADAKVELYMSMMGVTEQEARTATSDGYQMYIPITFNINVAAGTYNEVSSIRVPAFTSITGESLRASIINWDEERPADTSTIKNLFLVNNACYIYNLRLSNGPGVDNMYDPKTGFYFAFDNGAYISTSPYIQNCTTSYVPTDKFYTILDPGSSTTAEPNPLVGNGPGGMIVDDRNLDGYSPLKSMIVDAYTQVAFNGIGLCVRGRGYAQMVSFFTNFSRVGVYAIDGGHASLLNSNTTFGDYGLRARGKRFTVNARVDQVSDAKANPALAKEILDNKAAILQYMFVNLALNYVGVGYNDPNSYIYKATEKDASLLIDAIANDFLNSSADRTAQFVQGQFKGIDTSEGNVYTTASGAVAVYDLSLVDQFLDSFTFIKEGIENNVTIIDTELNKLKSLINMVSEVHKKVVKDNLSINDPKMFQDEDDPENTGIVRPFGSLITSTAHDFSYAGSGVNFLGLPSNQNGVGATDFDIRVFKDLNQTGEPEGRVYHTSGDEFGDFFAGDDFVIRQETGTIEGRTFSKALFALVTPFSLALES